MKPWKLWRDSYNNVWQIIGQWTIVPKWPMATVAICRRLEREREGDLYVSVVTGTHYGTKTPLDQQPTKLWAMTRLGAIYSTFSSMVSRVCCLV